MPDESMYHALPLLGLVGRQTPHTFLFTTEGSTEPTERVTVKARTGSRDLSDTEGHCSWGPRTRLPVRARARARIGEGSSWY